MFRLSASTSPTPPQFTNSYINSDAKPKDKSAKEKKKRWAKYGVASDASGVPLLGGLLDPLVVALGDLLGLPLGKQTIKIDTSPSGATAILRALAMAATFSRSRR